MTLCEKNMMFWEVSGMGSVILNSCGFCHFRNAPPRAILSLVIYFLLYSLSSLPLLVSLLFLYHIHKLYTPSVPGSTITLVIIPVVPTSQDGSAKSDLPVGGQEELGGVGHSQRMQADAGSRLFSKAFSVRRVVV